MLLGDASGQNPKVGRGGDAGLDWGKEGERRAGGGSGGSSSPTCWRVRCMGGIGEGGRGGAVYAMLQLEDVL